MLALGDRRYEREIDTSTHTGGDNNGERVGLAKASAEEDSVHILGGSHEADLVADDQQSNVFFVNPLKFVRSDEVTTEGSSVVAWRAQKRQGLQTNSKERRAK